MTVRGLVLVLSYLIPYVIYTYWRSQSELLSPSFTSREPRGAQVPSSLDACYFSGLRLQTLPLVVENTRPAPYCSFLSFLPITLDSRRQAPSAREDNVLSMLYHPNRSLLAI